jgi:putative membrane protein insertion efficiency factor
MRKRAFAVIVLVAVAIALDLRRPPSSQWSTATAVGGIHLYQATLSPVYQKLGVRCRFTLTCSHYGEEVVKKFGVMRGGVMAAKRILRCGPWTPAGTVDPVP